MRKAGTCSAAVCPQVSWVLGGTLRRPSVPPGLTAFTASPEEWGSTGLRTSQERTAGSAQAAGAGHSFRPVSARTEWSSQESVLGK